MKLSASFRTVLGCCASISFFQMASAVDVLHDKLPPLDGQIYEYTYSRPKLFGEESRTLYVRRSIENVSGVNKSTVTFTALSGTGSSIFLPESLNKQKAQRKLEETTFESVSGKVREELPGFIFPDENRVHTALSFPIAHALGQASQDIYLKLPLAAKSFDKSNFTEQHFIASVHSLNEAVVLKNEKSIVIATRGTEPTSVTNWITNIKFFQVPVLKGPSPRAHLGFSQAAADLFPIIRSHIVSTLENKIRKIVNEIKTRPGGIAKLASYGILGDVGAEDNRQIYLTGHSLGGAINSLIFGELTLNWLDTSNMGYYFVDPVLREVSDENINKLIKDTIEEEMFFDSDKPQTFSFFEQQDFGMAGKLTHLAVVQNEPTLSSDPDENIDGVTKDKRLNSLVTFGAPRSMDWIFKYVVEKYARASGSRIFRFENHHLNTGTDREGLLLGDLVPRVPLNKLNVGAVSIGPEFTHLGFRTSFETDSPDTQGNPDAIRCVYTDKANENVLNRQAEIQLTNGKFAFAYHKMGLYLSRVQSYVGAPPLPANHSCNNLAYKLAE